MPGRKQSWLRRVLEAGVETAAGRATRPDDLGEAPRDRVPIANAEALAHFVDALEDRSLTTVADLFRPRLRLAAAPNPSALFDGWRRRADGHGEPLRVLTYNTGLLSRHSRAFSMEVPEIAHRRAKLPPRLFADGWDALLLQEVWEPSDVHAFEREGAAAGYAVFAGTRHDEHGLLTAVRKAVMDPNAAQHFAEQQFAQQRRVEHFPGPGIRRGFVTWTFRHARTGLRIALFNTHTTAFLPYRALRMCQVRELGRAAAAGNPGGLTIVGGDVNSAPYYRDDAYRDGPAGWWANTLPYHSLHHYGGLVDAHVVAGAADDVTLGNKVALGRDVDTQRSTFTVTDGNSLYARQFSGLEFPARIDHVLFRDPSGRVSVDSSALQYTEPLAEGFELSDHYGVGTTFRISS